MSVSSQRSVTVWMVLVCVNLDRSVKIVNKVKLKSVRKQGSVIMWMVLVCVSLDGRVKIVNKVKLNTIKSPSGTREV